MKSFFGYILTWFAEITICFIMVYNGYKMYFDETVSSKAYTVHIGFVVFCVTSIYIRMMTERIYATKKDIEK